MNKPNGGHGDTILFAYEYALKNEATYVFQTDTDGQTNPEEFIFFWKQRKAFDAVIGVRKHRRDGLQRACVEKVLCSLLWMYFETWVPDANAPFRLMKATFLKKIIALIPEHYNLPNALITVLGVRLGFNICFTDITFGARQGGVNSINSKRIIEIAFRALRDFGQIRKTVLYEGL